MDIPKQQRAETGRKGGRREDGEKEKEHE